MSGVPPHAGRANRSGRLRARLADHPRRLASEDCGFGARGAEASPRPVNSSRRNRPDQCASHSRSQDRLMTRRTLLGCSPSASRDRGGTRSCRKSLPTWSDDASDDAAVTIAPAEEPRPSSADQASGLGRDRVGDLTHDPDRQVRGSQVHRAWCWMFFAVQRGSMRRSPSFIAWTESCHSPAS